jgi:hypothetical protein
MVAALLCGCAGKAPSMVELPKELPKEYQAKFQEKFEVRDESALPPAAPAPAPPKKRAKRSRKAKASAREAEPFAYPVRRPERDPMWVGEKLVYEVSYFGVVAGDFTVRVLPFKVMNNRKVYHIRGEAVSSRVFSLFYRLNDTVETFVDYDGLFSHRFRLILDESKQTRDALELYDSEKRETFYWNRWNHKDRGFEEKKETAEIEPFPQDSLSSLYYLRAVPLNVGETFTFPVISEGKGWEATISVLRRETIETPMGKMNTIVVKPQTRFRGVLQQQNDSYMWVSDDAHRYVVRLEAKVRIGTVVAKLREFERGSPPAPAPQESAPPVPQK